MEALVYDEVTKTWITKEELEKRKQERSKNK